MPDTAKVSIIGTGMVGASSVQEQEALKQSADVLRNVLDKVKF